MATNPVIPESVNKIVEALGPKVAEKLEGRFVSKEEAEKAAAASEARQKASDERAERFEKELAEYKAAAIVSPENKGSDPKRIPSLCKLLRGSMKGFGHYNDDDSYEASIFPDLEKKALSVGTDTSGGFLAPEEFNRFFVQRLFEDVALRAAVAADGGTPIPMPFDTLRLPAGNAAATADWTAENIDAALSSPTTRQITLTLKDLIGAVQISNKLIEFASPSADEYVRTLLSKAVSEKEDIDFLRADGSPAEEPTGLLNLLAAGQKFDPAGGVGTEVKFADLTKAERLLIEAKLKPPFVWIMNGRMFDRVRNLKDSQNRPLFEPDFFSANALSRLKPLGYPIILASQISNTLSASSDRSEIYLVKGSEILIGDSSAAPVLSASREFKFLADATVIKIVHRTDINVRHDVAAAVIENVLAT